MFHELIECMRKIYLLLLAAVMLGGPTAITSCSTHRGMPLRTDGQPAGQDMSTVFVPQSPDYSDAGMWYQVDGDRQGTGADIFYIVSTWEEDWQDANGRTSHYADVWNPTHRRHMATEISKAAAYMSPGNRFYAPYYRHTTMEAFLSQNDDTIRHRARLAMDDVCTAFDHFVSHRDPSRPLIIVGFSQGGMGVVELLKHISDETYSQLAAAYVLGYKVTPQDTLQSRHIRAAKGEKDTGVTICYNTVKDVKYVQPVIAATCMGINPVNWRTDGTPATLHDSITVTLSPKQHVLVVDGYSGSEYKAYRNFINVGDIHSCEPWLYSECLQRNMNVRAREWRYAKARQSLPLLISQRLDSLLNDPLFDTTQLGLMVWDLTTDSPLYSRGQQQRLRTASTMKLLTAVTALTMLGGDYKLSTSLYMKGRVEGRQLQGDLVCVGGMDPMFGRDDLRAFAQSLRQQGVASVRGQLIVDCTMKDAEKWGEGWCWDDDNPTLTPLLYEGKADFVKMLLQELRRQGVGTEAMRVVTVNQPEVTTTTDARLLCRRSHTLREVLVQMMKESDNLYAESVFYQVARWWKEDGRGWKTITETGTKTGTGTGTKNRTPLTATYGSEAATKLLETLGLPASRYRIADGSGLSLYDYLSAEAEVALLRHAWKTPAVYDDLLPSLPIAGEDGTLEKRMKGTSAHHNVQAKTGTVTSVSALAGYCTAYNGHRLCFAIMNQGIFRAAEGRSFQDRVCAALCSPPAQ